MPLGWHKWRRESGRMQRRYQMSWNYFFSCLHGILLHSFIFMSVSRYAVVALSLTRPNQSIFESHVANALDFAESLQAEFLVVIYWSSLLPIDILLLTTDWDPNSKRATKVHYRGEIQCATSPEFTEFKCEVPPNLQVGRDLRPDSGEAELTLMFSG